MSAVLEDFGVSPNTGQQRVLCPKCGDQNRKKTCGVNTDEGVFHCFRCGFKGRLEGPSSWLEDQLERARKSNRERDRRQRATAQTARMLWNKAERVTWHEYLKKKAVLPLSIRQSGNLLVIPMYDGYGRLWNCQTIDRDGTKLFLRGGRAKGLYYGIKGESQEIYIAEGFATAASLHLYHYPKCRVAVAFNADNLLPVARTIREKHPGKRLVIAADNDAWTQGNPGLTKAKTAAEAVRAKVIYPKFDGLDISDKPTDFCDLHLLQRESGK